MPVQDNTPPFSRRRAKVCTAGVSETAANKLLVAGIAKSCAKPRQHYSPSRLSQSGDIAPIIRQFREFTRNMSLLPLNCPRRLAGDIKTNAVNAFHFIDYP